MLQQQLTTSKQEAIKKVNSYRRGTLAFPFINKQYLVCVPFCIFVSISLFAQHQRTIKVDFNIEKGKLNRFFNECVGAGRANEGLRADWQEQLRYVTKECGFKYIRMHGLLCDDMGVYKEENGQPVYNFQYVDALFDALLRIGIKPFVELGFMPAALASGNNTVFWWRGNSTPPRNYQKWEDLIRALTLHFTERYGKQEVKTWYFEVWNEPNLDGFWRGTQADYFKLYRHSATAIKSVDSAYRVGGPATAGAAWVPEMLDYCKQNNVPIDFVSTHTYGVKQGFLDEFGRGGTVLSKDKNAVSGDVINSHKQIAQSFYPNLELHYTEWSSSYTPADPIHDSYHQAAYLLQKLKEVGASANSMSYWVFTDIFEEAGVRFGAFHSGFGLLTIQGINKPAFYAYQFLNKLSETELVNTDEASWVCKGNKGIQVLLWNYTNTHPGDSVHNQKYYIQNLPAKANGKVKVWVSGMPKGLYTLKVHRVGYRSNDAYTSFLDMGKPTNLTREQLTKIKQDNSGSPVAVLTVKVTSNGIFQKELAIKENEVFLLSMMKK